jgi:hypothetical protein
VSSYQAERKAQEEYLEKLDICLSRIKALQMTADLIVDNKLKCYRKTYSDNIGVLKAVQLTGAMAEIENGRFRRELGGLINEMMAEKVKVGLKYITS